MNARHGRGPHTFLATTWGDSMNQFEWSARRESRGTSGRAMRKPLRTLGLVWAGLAILAAMSYGQQPARTTITDIVYRADGSAASGTVLISWPQFTTADGKPVAAGTLNMLLGTGG